MNPLVILNKHHGAKVTDRNFYVGRNSPLGNPYPITETRSRETVIKDYETWLIDKIQAGDRAVLKKLNDIADKVLDGTNKPVGLICFCAPHRCHSEIIRKVINTTIKGEKYV